MLDFIPAVEKRAESTTKTFMVGNYLKKEKFNSKLLKKRRGIHQLIYYVKEKPKDFMEKE